MQKIDVLDAANHVYITDPGDGRVHVARYTGSHAPGVAPYVVAACAVVVQGATRATRQGTACADCMARILAGNPFP